MGLWCSPAMPLYFLSTVICPFSRVTASYLLFPHKISPSPKKKQEEEDFRKPLPLPQPGCLNPAFSPFEDEPSLIPVWETTSPLRLSGSSCQQLPLLSLLLSHHRYACWFVFHFSVLGKLSLGHASPLRCYTPSVSISPFSFSAKPLEIISLQAVSSSSLPNSFSFFLNWGEIHLP